MGFVEITNGHSSMYVWVRRVGTGRERSHKRYSLLSDRRFPSVGVLIIPGSVDFVSSEEQGVRVWKNLDNLSDTCRYIV